MTEAAEPGWVRAVVAAVSTTILGPLSPFLMATLSRLIREDMALSEATLGAGVGVFFLMTALASTPGGKVSERLGPRASMRLAILVGSLALTGAGLLSWNTGHLMLWLAAAGVGNGIAQPSANLSLARQVPVGRQGLAFGIKQSSIPLATLIAGLIVPAVGLTMGWRVAFPLTAVAAGGTAILSLPRESAAAPVVRRPRSARSLTGSLTVLAIGVGIGTAAASSLASFYVESTVRSGIPLEVAAPLLSLGSALGIGIRIVAGWRADNRIGGHLLVSAVMLATGAIGFALLAVGRGLPTLLVATVLAFCLGWGWTGLFNLAVVQRYPLAPGAATGVTQTGAAAGASVGPFVFGLVAANVSFALAWAVAAAWTGVAAGTLLWGRALLRRASDRSTAGGSPDP